MKARHGISPVIANVIIVAVMISMTIAVAGWVLGLWCGAGVCPEEPSLTLVDYWSQNGSCIALIGYDYRPPPRLVFISNDGIAVFTYNMTVKDAGHLYITDTACPDWLPNATITKAYKDP